MVGQVELDAARNNRDPARAERSRTPAKPPFIRVIRCMVLRAASLTDLWPDLRWFAGFTLLGLLVAAKRFKKRLD